MLLTSSISKGINRLLNLSIYLSCLLIVFITPGLVAADKEVVLKLAVLEGPKAARTVHGHKVWANAVEKASNSSIKVSLFPSRSLVSAKQMYDATANGLADVACISIGHYPGRFPFTESLSFPGSGISSPPIASEIIMKMYDKYPEMQKEFRAVKVLFFFGFAPMSIATVKKPVKTWNDLDGLRLRINHKGTANYLKTANVSPIFIPPPDIFLSLQKGIIDGSIMGWFGHHAFGTTKLANYFTEVPPVPGPFFSYIMNKRKFNSLSQKQKDALMSVSGYEGAKMFGQSGLKEIEVATESIRNDPDKEIISLTNAEINSWAEKAAEEQKIIIDRMKRKGYPIEQFMQDVKDMVKAQK